MPTNVFIALSEKKRENIIKVSIAEFSKYGYANSSTNRIVQDAGISKGSLFKYFKSKDELFFYILDFVTQELIMSLTKKIAILPKDLFERIIRYSELEFAWYIKHPIECKLITLAFTKSDTSIYRKIEVRYHLKEQDIYYKLLEDIDTSMLKWDKKKTVAILKASVMGVSQGGMIAQYLAIDYPNLVDKLVLAVTLSKQNELIQDVVTGWIEMAEQKDYQRLMVDTAEKSYSENYLRKHRLLYSLLGRLGKPKDFNRFLIQAASCIGHNSYPKLDKIVAQP